ncbi:MAG: restriction endonuclease subunit S [Treponema sp.]|nr:restriction endonuclease subunit S [Treponema sp.]
MTAKDLKNALLQEAVQGKLVPQIASEGNARDLLEEIRKEKLSHGLDFANAKSGKRKSKKETALAGSNPCDIKEEEIPFEIPENWCWCRLGEVVEIKTNLVDSAKYPDYIQIAPDDIGKGTGTLIKEKRTVKQKSIKSINHLFHEDMLLYSKIRPRLQKVVYVDFEGLCSADMYPLDTKISKHYLKYVLLSDFFDQEIKVFENRVKMPKLNIEQLNSTLFPLPPLAEQKRIVSAIEKFMTLIEEYGKKETELKAFNEQIGALTKKAILQEAFQGRLLANPPLKTSFDLPGNGPSCPQADTAKTRGINLQTGKALLEEIRKEKARLIKEGKLKKEKPLPEITEDEIPFDIPENWCWCRLGEICNLTSGQDLIPDQYNSQNKGIPYITGASNFSNENIIINRWTEYARAIAEENDLLLTCKGTVGEMAFLHEKKVHIARQVMGLHFDKKIDSRYMKYFITTQINNLKSKAKSMIPGIARDDVVKLTIPLPPLAEQKRIVAAIEKMLPLCEKLGGKEK